MTDVEEDVVLACVGYITGKMLADNAVPVGSVLAVEVLLDELGDLLFGVRFIEGEVNLLLNVLFHVNSHFTDDPLDVSLSHFYFKFFEFIINDII